MSSLKFRRSAARRGRGGRGGVKRRSVVLGVVGALVAGILVALAVRADGYPVTDVDLTASTVWVTNDAKGVVGRVNRQIDELNSAVKANKPGFDVLQEADTVLVRDALKHELRPVDVAAVILTGRIGIPESASVSFGGGVIGVTDQTSGALWAGTVDSLTGLDPATTDPLLTTGAGAVVTTSVHGTVFAVAPGRDELWRTQLTADGVPRDWATGEDGKPVPPEPGRLPGGALTPVAALVVSQQSPSVQLTAVGDVPVALDRGTGEVILPDRRISIPGGAEAVLQQPGPDTDAVLVSTPTAMLKIPLAGGDPVTVAQGVSGTPSAPVWLNGCSHGAWAAQQSSYAVACGSDPARVIEVPKAGAAATLVFRVNRSVIVLNDQASGNIWLVDADMKLISDWDNVQPQQDSSDQTAQDGDQNSSDQLTNSRADCAPGAVEAAAPTAAADAFGVRAGRATLLPVLINDSSADCSMVVISAVTPLPADVGSVTIANGGQALQVTVPAGAAGALPAVQYTVDDGQGRQATASATITVAAPEDTRAPVKVRDSVTLVEVGGTVSYTVLPDFSSPTGDDLSLIAASGTTDDSVTYQPNGMITFRDTGSAGAVKKTVDFTVSDGTSQTNGQLILDVKPEGSTKPVAGPIAARGVVGETVTAYPLRGVLSGIREPAKVTAVAPLTVPSGDPAGAQAATAQLSTLDSTVTLTGATAGTTYFLYTVVAGAGTATGVLRFDVADPLATPVPPVITPDVGYLMPGRTLVIDPLANDVDPMGSVMAVAGLSRAADSPLTATVHDLQLVQVSSSRTVPPGGVTLSYTAANAAGSSTGQIRVIPVPAPTTPQPPVASDIAVTVRAGDAVTIPIARYASDPTGERLTVKPFAAQSIPQDQGLLFATESAIRYLAPAVPPPTTVRFSYSVVNTDQLTDTRTVTISVAPADPAVNSAPRAPEQVTARVFAGHSATIALPLDGLDPDGDWVTFAGQTEPAPTLGRVDRAGPSAISYTALGAPGLDTAGYLASDPAGKQVKGSARIAVVAAPDVAEPPVAPDLDVVVRPGRTVAIDALGAASDPGGNTPFTFADPALVLPPGLDAELVKDAIVLTAPDADGVFPIKYTVRNSKGLAASGILTVTVSATAPLAPPTAKDVFVEAGSLSADGATAGVDVASAITNRSGQVSDLTVALEAPALDSTAPAAGAGGAASVAGTAITVPVTDARQVLAYRVTNLDGDTATAFVVVPPRGELAPPAQQNQQTEQPAAPPQARANVDPFTITAGQTASVPVLDFVQVDAGRTALVPEGAGMNASQGTVQRLDNSSLQYSVPDTAGGAAVINVQVSDGTSAAVFIPIPVVIIPTVIPPPVFTGASISVEKGLTATQDLAGLVSTANDEQRQSLTFSGPSGLGNGLTGSLDGSILTVTADPAAQRGASSTATVTVSDGTNSVTGAVAVTVVGSTAALASVAANRQVEAIAGQPVSIPVLDGAYNPFPDTPLTIVAATASGGIPVQISGSTLSLTPPAGLLDQLNLSFTVADATGDADRQVQGTVTVIPLAKPDAPTAVVATSLGKPDSVDVAWRAPALTRPAITSYTIYWSGGQTSCGADAGHCPVGPLTPGTSYTFEVSATNDQGEGLRSAPSAEITPDVEPDVPAAPTVTWKAAGSVIVAWKPPNNTGSAIASYLLTANTGAVRTVAAGEGTSSEFTGLDPATEVNFTLSATNSTGKTSQTSAASNSLYPSDTTRPPGKPDLQAGIDASKVRTIAVTWAAAQPRGDPAESYLVTVNGNTSTVTAPATSFTIGGVRDGVEYAVSVVARNHVGDSAASPSTSLTTSPDVANVTDAEAIGNSQIRVTVEPTTTAGGKIDSFEIYVNGSRRQSGGISQDITVDSTGTPYTFNARACANGTCSSDVGRSASASAYGPLATPPTPSASASGTVVSFGWTWPNGNGRAVLSRKVTVSGVGPVPDTGSWSGDIGYSSTRDITIEICVSGPPDCTTASVTSPRTVPQPPPATVTRVLGGDATGHIGSSANSVICLGPRCRFIDVQVKNFPPNTPVRCTVVGSTATARTTDGAGNVYFDWGWYSGTPEVEIATCSGGGVSAKG